VKEEKKYNSWVKLKDCDGREIGEVLFEIDIKDQKSKRTNNEWYKADPNSSKKDTPQ